MGQIEFRNFMKLLILLNSSTQILNDTSKRTKYIQPYSDILPLFKINDVSFVGLKILK